MEVESEVKELKEEFRQMKKIVRKNFLLQWVLSHELRAACNDSLNEIQGKWVIMAVLSRNFDFSPSI